jgi:hypothetical protein
MTWPELVSLGLVAAWNLRTYAFVWMAATPGRSAAHGAGLSGEQTAASIRQLLADRSPTRVAGRGSR